VARDIYGVTGMGEFGLRYQLDVLDRFSLKGVFFIESLFASEVGPDYLKSMVELIRGRDHDIQLHVHPEWLRWMGPTRRVRGKNSQFLKDFSEDEQVAILGAGLANLRDCGARERVRVSRGELRGELRHAQGASPARD